MTPRTPPRTALETASGRGDTFALGTPGRWCPRNWCLLRWKSLKGWLETSRMSFAKEQMCVCYHGNH